jgi:hypothetical protein
MRVEINAGLGMGVWNGKCIVGHLGLVAGIYDALGIGEVIDRALPKTRHHKLPHSIVVKFPLQTPLKNRH